MISLKGVVKDSVDCSFKKDGNLVVLFDNLIHIPDLGVSLHIRSKSHLEDFEEVNLIPHSTKERNMVWFSVENK